MEYNTLSELKEQLSRIPKGTITKKNINGHVRFYFQWRDENGKTKNLYIKEKELDYYKDLVEKRKSIESQIKMMSFDFCVSSPEISYLYKTAVVTGDNLISLCNSVSNFEKRDCFSNIVKFLTGSYVGKICTLYGLRRTGKTTLIFQSIDYLNYADCAYIKINADDNMSNLKKDIDLLVSKGIKYLFIDEITLMEDFINCSSLLSDIYGSMGIKIVVSGTDSLGFEFANRDELYDRNIMIHTSYISFSEFRRLLKINSIDSYIEYGGTLSKENMNFDDPDYSDEGVSFRTEESTRKYIDSAISKNIQHSLRYDHFGLNFSHLRNLYEKNELTNVINRIVESMSHEFVVSIIKDKFKSHDLGSAKQILLRENNKNSHILYDIDANQVIERLKVITEIREKEETEVDINEDVLKQVKIYLSKLDLIKEITIFHEDMSPEKYYAFTQPGMRYSLAKALVYSLNKDDYFLTIGVKDREYIINKILEDVKGRMLEDIVILDTISKADSETDVFKYKFTDGGEYDMVVVSRKNLTCKIYEIKHSLNYNQNQTRYLNDNEKTNLISFRYGNIIGKYVVYRGESMSKEGIQYLNVEDMLSNK